jgi:hypothetical protein
MKGTITDAAKMGLGKMIGDCAGRALVIANRGDESVADVDLMAAEIQAIIEPIVRLGPQDWDGYKAIFVAGLKRCLREVNA